MSALINTLQLMWASFRENRVARYALWLFVLIFVLSMMAPLIANDKPLWIRYKGELYFPVLHVYSERTFGGVFESEADYLDPSVQALINKDGSYVMPVISASASSISPEDVSHPAPPSRRHWLGTDDVGRDVLARILYGLKSSLSFGLILGLAVSLMGLIFGLIQGTLGGVVDLVGQRLTEVWQSLPELFVLMVLASLIYPSLGVLFTVMLSFGWIMSSQLVRAEVLRVRRQPFVLAAVAMGASRRRIIGQHILPAVLWVSLSGLPFVVVANVLALTALDFLGFGLPVGAASLGELIMQGKNNLDAPWIALSAFLNLTGVLVLLVFIGDGLKDAVFVQRK